MINPNQIIDYNRTDAELEELVLFLIAVAGKNADTTSKNLAKFLKAQSYPNYYNSPFEFIRNIQTEKGAVLKADKKGQLIESRYSNLAERLNAWGFGCQTRLARAFTEVANSGLNLRTCSLEDLMKIHGIGRKSASCFLAWTRKGVKVAMLDTHLLKWLRLKQEQARKLRVNATGNIEAWRPFLELEIPKSTPTSKRVYDLLEEFYLEWCETTRNDPTEMDLKIWRSYANK